MTTTPAITDALRAEARSNPGTWVYAIDPGFGGTANVPPEGVVGAWRSDEQGEITGDFTPNPRHLPTPQARGWTEPLTRLERVLQLVLSGYLPAEHLSREVASAELVVLDRPGGGLVLVSSGDGGPVVHAHTDPARATASGWAAHRSVRGSEVAAALPDGTGIELNPGSAVSAVVDPADVTRA